MAGVIDVILLDSQVPDSQAPPLAILDRPRLRPKAQARRGVLLVEGLDPLPDSNLARDPD